MIEVILKHISEITTGEFEDLFTQGYDMEVDKHTKIVLFKRDNNVLSLSDSFKARKGYSVRVDYKDSTERSI